MCLKVIIKELLECNAIQIIKRKRGKLKSLHIYFC